MSRENTYTKEEMYAYKYETGQRVLDNHNREGVITYRYRTLGVNKYTLDSSTGTTFTAREDDLTPVHKPKFERGDWVAVRGSIVGYVENSERGYGEGAGYSYSVYSPTTGCRFYTEDKLTKIEHDFRPGDRVTFTGWAPICGDYTVTGVVTKLTTSIGVDIRCDKTQGIYGRSAHQLTKIEKPAKADLPMPPKFDTLKTRTVTTTFTNVDPKMFKLLTGWDIPTDSKRIKEAREALDKQIKDAEAELKKLKDARAAL